MADNEKKVNINMDPAVAGGIYSNLAIISHSHSEFIIDFAAVLPGLPGPKVESRILMTPEHAKRLLNALAENIGKYENQYGKIEIVNQQPRGTFNLADFNPSDAKS
ncbi:MAG: DUF3467 domain-containing protein [Bacteroidales bacterium]|nr:DUF3467 domain-containing protein [Bacteroidales bacterium]